MNLSKISSMSYKKDAYQIISELHNKLTYKQIAEKAGISTSTIYRIRKGKTKPKSNTILAIKTTAKKAKIKLTNYRKKPKKDIEKIDKNRLFDELSSYSGKKQVIIDFSIIDKKTGFKEQGFVSFIVFDEIENMDETVKIMEQINDLIQSLKKAYRDIIINNIYVKKV